VAGGRAWVQAAAPTRRAVPPATDSRLPRPHAPFPFVPWFLCHVWGYFGTAQRRWAFSSSVPWFLCDLRGYFGTTERGGRLEMRLLPVGRPAAAPRPSAGAAGREVGRGRAGARARRARRGRPRRSPPPSQPLATGHESRSPRLKGGGWPNSPPAPANPQPKRAWRHGREGRVPLGTSCTSRSTESRTARARPPEQVKWRGVPVPPGLRPPTRAARRYPAAGRRPSPPDCGRR
jgi:hypothetical protein